MRSSRSLDLKSVTERWTESQGIDFRGVHPPSKSHLYPPHVSSVKNLPSFDILIQLLQVTDLNTTEEMSGSGIFISQTWVRQYTAPRTRVPEYRVFRNLTLPWMSGTQVGSKCVFIWVPVRTTQTTSVNNKSRPETVLEPPGEKRKAGRDEDFYSVLYRSQWGWDPSFSTAAGSRSCDFTSVVIYSLTET